MAQSTSDLTNKLPDDCQVPVHIAIIMDGNGRWAQQHGLSRLEGHIEGRKATRRVVEACDQLGVEVLSLYTFSVQNWERPDPEVAGLMELIEGALHDELNDLSKNNIRFIASGRRGQLPQSLQQILTEVEENTAGNDGLILNLLISYGGRAEIVDAARALARRVQVGEIAINDINEVVFANHLYAPALPDPDLLLRPGGEMRISNFLLWEIAYAEIIVMPVLWPDFSGEHLVEAIKEYNRRQRRFGRVVATDE